MIYLRTAAGIFQVKYSPSLTVDQMVYGVTNEHGLEIRESWNVQETQTGRVLLSAENPVDDRNYHLNAILIRRGSKASAFAPT